MHIRLIWLSSVLCLFLYDCGGSSRFAPSASDPSKGTVTGSVTCADTGKPARFATVQLVPSTNGSGDQKTTGNDSAITGLDGKFTMAGVAPGDYYAFATLDGYLDPTYGIDFDRIDTSATEDKLDAEMIEQWKEHMVEVSVSAQKTSDLSVSLERGAEITGAVSYDDGSPAAGLRFALYRRNEKGGWSIVGMPAANSFTIDAKSGARGRYDIANLSAGEYVICTLLPADNQANSPQVCLGNTFRRRDANTLTLQPGDVENGADIEIPLGKIHFISGSVAQAANNQPVSSAKIHLFYADDREVAMTMDLFSDGTFILPFVPEGSYILRVTDASWSEPAPQTATAPGNTPAAKMHALVAREVPVTVDRDVTNLTIGLAAVPDTPANAATNGPPAAASPQ